MPSPVLTTRHQLWHDTSVTICVEQTIPICHVIHKKNFIRSSFLMALYTAWTWKQNCVEHHHINEKDRDAIRTLIYKSWLSLWACVLYSSIL